MENMLAPVEVDTATASPMTEFQGRVDEAQGRDPPDPERFHQLGLEAERAGDATLALELLSRAAEIDSNSAAYFVSIARLLAAQTMFNQAALAYLRALELATPDPLVLLELASVLRSLNREEDALAVLRKRDELRQL
jgi:tetratricopeptide (TPR) repeat protein